MEEGKFDNLRGKGKPLALDENPYEPEEWRAAFRLLKNNDFTLPWIEAWAEIEREREQARQRLRAGRSASGQPSEAARAAFLIQVAGLNRRILEYNLTVPRPVFQKPLLDPEKELQAALAD